MAQPLFFLVFIPLLLGDHSALIPGQAMVNVRQQVILEENEKQPATALFRSSWDPLAPRVRSI